MRETPEISSPRKQLPRGSDALEFEPSVKPAVVGQYLGIDAATVVRFAKAGVLPGYPLRVSGHRTHWRFLLSEIRRAMLERE